MNIFIMFLVMLFMAGYYIMDSPSQHATQTETEYAITKSDLRAIAQCAATTQNAQINGTEFADQCIEQNGINSQFICLNASLKITECKIVKNKKPAFSYIITVTAPLDETLYNNMMEILETYYADAGTFGLYMDGRIVAGGTSAKRAVPTAIVEQMELIDGQLIYLTQYEIPDAATEYEVTLGADVVCPTGTAETYRFGRWQCVGYNVKTDCGGDMIWDSDLLECVADESRKPLCAETQTAVMVDSVWECINPFPEKSCPSDMVARLNYNTLEWECVTDPTNTADTKKCENITQNAVYGVMGATLRVPQTSCTDCEKLITDYDTCTSFCVPDPSRVADPRCYPAATRTCSGPSRAFYFGFPNASYVANVEAVADAVVPLDRAHSQNRKFKCLDCGDGEIDTARSLPPYIAVCK